MCTAVSYLTKGFYFGRTLDNECSYGEEIAVTPRGYPFRFRNMGVMDSHYAMIGMAHVADGVPLYYDAGNEKGLAMAGLNFVGNAFYGKAVPGRDCVAQFELIPWILGQCACVGEAKELLRKICLTDESFSEAMPAAQLHWMIADKDGSITLEAEKDGLHIWDNPVGVLTNNPPFDELLFHLNNYMNLSAKPPENRFSSKLPLRPYSRGMGALGLPGDLSSQSRFVRAAFVRMNAVSGSSEEESVGQFFHILGSVEQQRGCCDLGDGKYEMTIYTSCYSAERRTYYYTSYGNRQITAVPMPEEEIEGSGLIRYPMIQTEQIRVQESPGRI